MSLIARRWTRIAQAALLVLAAFLVAVGCEAEDAPCDDDARATPEMALSPTSPTERALGPVVLVRMIPSYDADPVSEGDDILLRWDGDPGVVYAITGAGRFRLEGRGPDRSLTATDATFLLEWDDCGRTTISFLHFRRAAEPS